jgi:hypothetical protein
MNSHIVSSAHGIEAIFDGKNAADPCCYGDQNNDPFPEGLLERVHTREKQNIPDEPERKRARN